MTVQTVGPRNTQIFKFPLEITDSRVCTLEMPQGAEPLSVGVQRETIQLWAWCDSSQPLQPRRFIILMTGDRDYDQQNVGRFLGTVLLNKGMYVLHVFTHPDD